MVESLRLAATEDTPMIDFDTSTGIFKVSGRSLPEDALEFLNRLKNG